MRIPAGYPEVLWKRPIPVTDLIILHPVRSCLSRQHPCIQGGTGPVFSRRIDCPAAGHPCYPGIRPVTRGSLFPEYAAPAVRKEEGSVNGLAVFINMCILKFEPYGSACFGKRCPHSSFCSLAASPREKSALLWPPMTLVRIVHCVTICKERRIDSVRKFSICCIS